MAGDEPRGGPGESEEKSPHTVFMAGLSDDISIKSHPTDNRNPEVINTKRTENLLECGRKTPRDATHKCWRGRLAFHHGHGIIALTCNQMSASLFRKWSQMIPGFR